MISSSTPQPKRTKPAGSSTGKTRNVKSPYQQAVATSSPGSFGAPKQGRLTVAARRKWIAELRLQGYVSQAEIAQIVGVNRSTIHRDFQVLDGQFRDQATMDVTSYRAIDLARIEFAIRALWPKIAEGNVLAIREFRGLLERKAKMLGLDAPALINVVDWRAELAQSGVDTGAIFEQVVSFVQASLASGHAQQLLVDDLLEGEIVDQDPQV